MGMTEIDVVSEAAAAADMQELPEPEESLEPEPHPFGVDAAPRGGEQAPSEPPKAKAKAKPKEPKAKAPKAKAEPKAKAPEPPPPFPAGNWTPDEGAWSRHLLHWYAAHQQPDEQARRDRYASFRLI